MLATWPATWLRPDWPAPPQVWACFTTRSGGASRAPFDSLNLGNHVGDAPAAVAANRTALAQAVQAQPVFMRQVHGVAVADWDQDLAAEPVADEPVADGCITSRPGVAAVVMVADCLPVLLTDTQGQAVAAAHAGWRGLAGESGVGVLETTVAAVRQRVGGADVLAWLGPCIGPTAFEVGAEVRAAFCAVDAGAAACFTPTGQPQKFWANLPALARRRLAALGVTAVYGNDGSAAWCTVGRSDLFFSHRRDAARLGSTGRMAAVIGLR